MRSWGTVAFVVMALCSDLRVSGFVCHPVAHTHTRHTQTCVRERASVCVSGTHTPHTDVCATAVEEPQRRLVDRRGAVGVPAAMLFSAMLTSSLFATPAHALGRKGRKEVYGAGAQRAEDALTKAEEEKERLFNNAGNKDAQNEGGSEGTTEEEVDPFADLRKKKKKKKPSYCEVNRCGY